MNVEKLLEKIDRFGFSISQARRHIAHAMMLIEDLGDGDQILGVLYQYKTLKLRMYLNDIHHDEVKLDKTLKETIEYVQGEDTGIMTVAHMEVIRSKWEERPDLMPVVDEKNIGEMTMLEGSKVKLEGYRSHVENVYALMTLLILWEDLHWCTRKLAKRCDDLALRIEVFGEIVYAEDLMEDIRRELFGMEAFFRRASMMNNNYSDFTYRFESSLFSGLKPIVTRIIGCLASDLSDADAVEKMQETLSEIIPQLNEQVRLLETAGNPASLVKGVNPASPGLIGGGGGGGAEAEAARRVLALQDVYKEWRELYKAIEGEATPLDDTGKDHGERQKAMHDSLLEWADGMVSTAPTCDRSFQFFGTTGKLRWQALGDLYERAYGEEEGERNLNDLKKIIRSSIGDQATGDPTSELIERLNTLGEKIKSNKHEQREEKEKEKKRGKASSQ